MAFAYHSIYFGIAGFDNDGDQNGKECKLSVTPDWKDFDTTILNPMIAFATAYNACTKSKAQFADIRIRIHDNTIAQYGDGHSQKVASVTVRTDQPASSGRDKHIFRISNPASEILQAPSGPLAKEVNVNSAELLLMLGYFKPTGPFLVQGDSKYTDPLEILHQSTAG